jgi:hypothetical protein
MTEPVEPITWRDLAQCCDREWKLRERVYSRWVPDKKITQAKANRELALMRAAAAHFHKLADDEDRKTRL